jgi:hypothetical protein
MLIISFWLLVLIFLWQLNPKTLTWVRGLTLPNPQIIFLFKNGFSHLVLTQLRTNSLVSSQGYIMVIPWRDQTKRPGDARVIPRDICDTCPTLEWTSTHRGTMQDRWCHALYNHPHASTYLVATNCRTYLHSNHVAIWSKKYRLGSQGEPW